MGKTNFLKRDSAIGTVIAAVCILVYLFALVYTIVRINRSMDEQRYKAENEFYAITRVIEEIPAASYMSEDHKNMIQTSVRNSFTIEGIVISGEYGFEKNSGKTIVQARDGNPIGLVDRFNYLKLLPFPVNVTGQRNVVVEARANKFNYSELAGILTNALFMIMAALVLSFLTLLIESRGKEKSKKKIKSKPESSRASSYSSESPAPRTYSKRGNVIPEEFTESRLAEELQYSIRDGIDLAFITVEFKMPVDDANYERFALDAARFFSSRDFVCERGLKGISVICPGLNIETAFLNAEEFHNRVMGKYLGILMQKTDLCIGISSRSQRYVAAERLMFEAEEALERAMMDPVSHIVAFKSDPAKYREFMESREEV